MSKTYLDDLDDLDDLDYALTILQAFKAGCDIRVKPLGQPYWFKATSLHTVLKELNAACRVVRIHAPPTEEMIQTASTWRRKHIDWIVSSAQRAVDVWLQDRTQSIPEIVKNIGTSTNYTAETLDLVLTIVNHDYDYKPTP